MKVNVNVGRVVLGGLVAGLIMTISQYVLNEIVLAEAMAEQFAALNLTPPGGSMIALFIAVTFVIGIATIWLYAMLRSHGGPGAGTAVCTGLFVWFFYALLSNFFFWALGVAGGGPAITATIWTLVEIPVATVAGAYLYQE